MQITEALMAAMGDGRPICRKAWNRQVKLTVDPESDFFFGSLWDGTGEGEKMKWARWIPKAEDILEDDWEVVGDEGER